MVGCYNSGVATAKNGSSHKEEQNEKSNHYLLLNAPMASLASLLRISSPLIAARSAKQFIPMLRAFPKDLLQSAHGRDGFG